MPTPNYHNGLIYKLVKQDDYDNENIYIGSTTNFRGRKAGHKCSCNNPENKDYNQIKYQIIRETEFNNWDMIQIEPFPCNSKKELETRERYWIDFYKPNLNKNMPLRSQKESSKKYREENAEKIKEQSKKYYEENPEKVKEQSKKYREENAEKVKEYSKKYREENPEKIKEKSKKYREENPEKVKEQSKKYREENPEKLKEKYKKYREENPEKLKEKNKKYREENPEKIKEKAKEQITCECGCILTRCNLTKHKKTQKHLDLMAKPL